MKGALLIDIGSTYTKVTAVDMHNACVIGTAKSFTTIETDVNEGLQNAVTELKQRIGSIDYEIKLACSSAAGGLKMVAVGLVPDLTAEAARMAALSAGAKVMKTYSYELSHGETEEIALLKPDIVLLSGGTDGGNKSVILHNAKMLAAIDLDFPVVVAGNKAVVEEAAALLTGGGKQAIICENVMKQFNKINIEPARQIIREIFLQRIVLAKGLTNVQELIRGILMPTPAAVLKAVGLLSKGYDHNGLGELMVLDVGGATTDVYSVADGLPTKASVVLRGLQEPFEKRTVEGDLGVRYSADALIEAAGIDELRKTSGLTEWELNQCINKIDKYPDITVEDDEAIGALDWGLAGLAVKIAVKRHAGHIESCFTPFGTMYLQTGKDLTNIKYVIGTGGPIINSINAQQVLRQAQFDGSDPTVLNPRKPEFMLDKDYIFAAMGLLSDRYPEMAFNIMKNELY